VEEKPQFIITYSHGLLHTRTILRGEDGTWHSGPGSLAVIWNCRDEQGAKYAVEERLADARYPSVAPRPPYHTSLSRHSGLRRTALPLWSAPFRRPKLAASTSPESPVLVTRAAREKWSATCRSARPAIAASAGAYRVPLSMDLARGSGVKPEHHLQCE
jgi:hypothetical protein